MKKFSQRTLSALAAAAIAAGGVGAVAPAAVAQEAPAVAPAAGERQVIQSQLNWGIRDTWNNYITGKIAQGDVEADGAAVQIVEGASDRERSYQFNGNQGGVVDDKIVIPFNGTLRFWGHAHRGDDEAILDGTYSNFVLVLQGNQARLCADMRYRPFESTEKAAPFKEAQNVPFSQWQLAEAVDPNAETVQFQSAGEGQFASDTVHESFGEQYLDNDYTAPMSGFAQLAEGAPTGLEGGNCDVGPVASSGGTGNAPSVGGATAPAPSVPAAQPPQAAPQKSLADTGVPLVSGVVAALGAVAALVGVAFATLRRRA